MSDYANIPYKDYQKVLNDLKVAEDNLKEKCEIIAALGALIIAEGTDEMKKKMTLKLAEIIK